MVCSFLFGFYDSVVSLFAFDAGLFEFLMWLWCKLIVVGFSWFMMWVGWL